MNGGFLNHDKASGDQHSGESLVFKDLNSSVEIHDDFQGNLHGQFSYEMLRQNKDCLKYSLYPRTIPEWNLLPDDFKTAPDLDKFKTMLASLDVESLVQQACYHKTRPLYRDNPTGRCVQYQTRTRT